MQEDARSHIERAGYRVQLIDREARRPPQMQPPSQGARLDPGRVGQPLDGQTAGVEHAPDALRQLAYYKAPGYVAFVEALPLTASQKIQRGELRVLAQGLPGQAHCVDTRHLKKRTD